jgi:hypothetical protein
MDGGVAVADAWWVVALRAGAPLLRAVIGASVEPFGPHADVLREVLDPDGDAPSARAAVSLAHGPDSASFTGFTVCPVPRSGPSARRRTARAWSPRVMVAWIGVPGPDGEAALAVFSAPRAKPGGPRGC